MLLPVFVQLVLRFFALLSTVPHGGYRRLADVPSRARRPAKPACIQGFGPAKRRIAQCALDIAALENRDDSAPF